MTYPSFFPAKLPPLAFQVGYQSQEMSVCRNPGRLRGHGAAVSELGEAEGEVSVASALR